MRMKDTTISYDIAHHQQQQQQQQEQQQQQQHQQQQQQHIHQQQQPHSWNQHQRQHLTHTTSVYGNQRSNVSQQHGTAQLDQYHHQQQLQSTPHQNPAYYQQAQHIYPTYAHGHAQQDQHQHHSVSGAGSSSVVNAGVVGSTTNQQGLNNAQASTALNHTGWSMTPQAHHAVVTDHSNLSYMAHGYQNHNTPLSDHRNTQPIGTGPQGSTYTVDSLYNTPVAAAAAAYGYNNYNAPFFQTSSNQTHPQSNISTFWNHGQSAPQQQPQQQQQQQQQPQQQQQQQQQRATHSQAVPNQASIQHRQPMASDQGGTPNNYMHDPLMYYGRPTYGQNLQNFGQSQTQAQADVLHQRMTVALSQQLLQHHEQQLHQVAAQQHQQLHPQQSHTSIIGSNQQQTSELPDNQMLQTATHQSLNRQLVGGQLTSTISETSPMNQLQLNRQLQQLNLDSQPQKSSPIELDNTNKHGQYDINTTNTPQQQVKHPVQKSSTMSLAKDLNISGKQPLTSDPKESLQQNSNNPQSMTTKQTIVSTQNVIKNDEIQYQRKTQDSTQVSAGRSGYYRDSHEDRTKSQTSDMVKKSETERKDLRPNPESKNSISESNSKRIENSDKVNAIEESIATLSEANSSPRKTTWALIASQPAKVSQPKSLKSKIAASNSVLSSAKHLAAVSLESANIDAKNGINPAIKSSVSAAATSIQTRSSVPPPISKLPAVVASLKLDLLGKDADTTKISWPDVNASINLQLDDPPLQKETSPNNNSPSVSNNSDTKQRRDFDGYRNRDNRNFMYNDNNQNSRNANSNQSHSGREPYWSRRDNRDDRIRRDSDRKDSSDKEESREPEYNRRGGDNNRANGAGTRSSNHFRGDERDQYRERDRDREYVPSKSRGPASGRMMNDRSEARKNDSYQNERFNNSRFESRNSYQNSVNSRQQQQQQQQQANDNNQQTQHHHYNNVRDGNTAGSSISKQDLTLYPQLDPANFNPKSFDIEPKEARYFVIKSYSEDDIHKSIKYSIWCSTNHGNKRLDEAFKQQQQRTKDGPIYLFFSVNGSGHFCGMAQMMSSVDFNSSSGVWAQSKWQGEFSVKWIFVKDVPNGALRHITLENNEDKPVTNSRDTQEVPSEKGRAVLKILHKHQHTTSLFDDFLHYERRQEEEKSKKTFVPDQAATNNRHFDDRGNGRGSNGRGPMYNRPHNEFQNMRDRSSRFGS